MWDQGGRRGRCVGGSGRGSPEHEFGSSRWGGEADARGRQGGYPWREPAVQQRQARQSIVGLLMNPTTLYIYLPRSTRKGTFRFELVKKDVRDFDEVLAALDIVFGFLVEVGTRSRPSTSEGGEIRQEIASLRLMVRQGQQANEELRDAVATLTTQETAGTARSGGPTGERLRELRARETQLERDCGNWRSGDTTGERLQELRARETQLERDCGNCALGRHNWRETAGTARSGGTTGERLRELRTRETQLERDCGNCALGRHNWRETAGTARSGGTIPAQLHGRERDCGNCALGRHNSGTTAWTRERLRQLRHNCMDERETAATAVEPTALPIYISERAYYFEWAGRGIKTALTNQIPPP